MAKSLTGQKYRLHGQPRADDVAHDQIRVVELTGERFLADSIVAMVLGMPGKNARPDLGRNVGGGPIAAYLPPVTLNSKTGGVGLETARRRFNSG